MKRQEEIVSQAVKEQSNFINLPNGEQGLYQVLIGQTRRCLTALASG